MQNKSLVTTKTVSQANQVVKVQVVPSKARTRKLILKKTKIKKTNRITKRKQKMKMLEKSKKNKNQRRKTLKNGKANSKNS